MLNTGWYSLCLDPSCLWPQLVCLWSAGLGLFFLGPVLIPPQKQVLCATAGWTPTPTFPLFHAGSVPFGPKKSPAPIWVLLHSMAQDWHLQGNFLVIRFISYFRVWTSLLALLVLTLCSVAQSCPVVCSPMDCSPPGSSAHEIFQARILEWGAICFSRGIFPTQGSNPHLLHLLHC